MIRRAIETDSYNIAKLIVSGWQTAYKGLIDDNFLNNMSVDFMSTKWKENISSQDINNNIYVYEKNNLILGIIRFGKPDDINSKYNSEVHVLYVEPTLKRAGIGTELFTFAKQYFINKKITNLIIWCLKNNTPAIKFYEKMGGKIVTTRQSMVNNLEVEEVGIEYNLLEDSCMEIVEFHNKYTEQISKIIIENLIEVNSKDYGLEYVKKTAKEFTPEEILNTFPKRTKVFVALENNTVVGTAGIDKSWYNDDGEYWILTVFVDVKHHKKGIGKMLIQEIEKFALTIPAKKLVIPASIHGCEFYHKLGYDYANGKKELNKDKMYMMEKYL